MQTTGLFTTHSLKANIRGAKKLIIFGDVHRDSPNFALDKWRAFLEYARKQRDALFLGMGDYLDSTSTSERGFLTRGEWHETIKDDLANLTKAKVRKFAKEIAFMRGRLVGLIGGNHYFAFESGATSDHMLCDLMECKFLGVSSLIRIEFADATVRVPFTIFAHHGAGGARLFGGSINRVDQMREIADADLYCMGHDHQRGIVPARPRIYLSTTKKNGLVVRERQQYLARTGSFLAAYNPGSISYNADACRGPCSLGHVEIELRLRRRTPTGEPREAKIEVKCIS